jgi:Rap1a immunity proteins
VKTKAIVLFMSVLLTLPALALAGAVSEKDFSAETTENLINLCTAAPDDPLYQGAVNFCHGYLVGAFAYYQAESAGPKGIKLVCLPDPPPSRNEAIKMFIEWAKAHPQYMKEKPVETEFRFLMEKWPCKP